MLLRKAKGLLELIRPELPFAAGVCVVLGEIIALGKFPSTQNLLLGFVWGFFLSAPAMILNDYFDIEVDKINAPNRPLASGLISPTMAVLLTVITSLIGLAASILINSTAIILYIGFWLVGLVYNWKLKEFGLWGNLMVSTSVAVTFVLGGIIVEMLWSPAVWALSLMVFLINLGEEIAADAMDIEGDKVRGVRSVPILIGKLNALRISVTLFILAMAISYIPVLLGILGVSYLVIISITNASILFFGLKLLMSRNILAGRIAIRGVYLSGLIGLIMIIISRVS